MAPDAGANDALSAGDLGDELLGEGGHLHVAGYSLLRAGSRDAARAAIGRASREGMTVSVDPSSSALLSPDFLDWAEGVVRTVVGVKGLVTPDDLQDAMDADEMRPPNPGLVGVLWNRLRRLGLVRTTEEHTSKAKTSNGRRISVWRPGPTWGRAAS